MYKYYSSLIDGFFHKLGSFKYFSDKLLLKIIVKIEFEVFDTLLFKIVF